MVAAGQSQSLQDFLQPLAIDLPKVISLASSFYKTYKSLAAESENQFLPTPISDSILKPSAAEGGRYLAIDVGGTNLRVGFVELYKLTEGKADLLSSNGVEDDRIHKTRVQRKLEQSWPITEYLKYEKAEDLFEWIGDRIAEVVEVGMATFGQALPAVLPMGVTFSFPMIQHTLSDATLMSMGKGFAITSNLDLGKQLQAGYAQARSRRKLPDVKIMAILNDTVATLISLAYQLKVNPQRKAAMGLIVGTGTNATIPLKLSSLHPRKRLIPENVATAADLLGELKIMVNTEWSINGAAGPLRELNLITYWDKVLDKAGTTPGFQPFEYMCAGGYLGELGRLIIIDYLTTQLSIQEERLPAKLRQRNGLTTSFLGNFRADQSQSGPLIIKKLSQELPPNEERYAWHWTAEASEAVSRIAKEIQVRAAGMTAAAIIGLLVCAGDLNFGHDHSIQRASSNPNTEELMVGYTGGCIAHFQDYLEDCQRFLDDIMDAKFEGQGRLRVVLQPCHDGGIVGAGVLAATVQDLSQDT